MTEKQIEKLRGTMKQTPQNIANFNKMLSKYESDRTSLARTAATEKGSVDAAANDYRANGGIITGIETIAYP